jgi:hypothetical protein
VHCISICTCNAELTLRARDVDSWTQSHSNHDQIVNAGGLLGAFLACLLARPAYHVLLRTYAVHIVALFVCVSLAAPSLRVSLSRVESGSCVLLVMRVGEVADGWHRAAIDHRGGCVCAVVTACMCKRCGSERGTAFSCGLTLMVVGEVVSRTLLRDGRRKKARRVGCG